MTVSTGFVEELPTSSGDELIEAAVRRVLHECNLGSSLQFPLLLEPVPDQARRDNTNEKPDPAHHKGDQHRRSFQVVSMTISVAARLTMSPMACSRLAASGTVWASCCSS